MPSRVPVLGVVLPFLFFLAAIFLPATARADACSSPANAIVAENCQSGNPASEWDISGAGDATIQGYGTDISVNRGQTISFKVNTNASAYHIDIYRIGFYGGNGARKITTITPSVSLPQTQPACLTDSTTGLTDCGNWAVSASWSVPATAVSGLYIGRLVREDTGGASHMVFIVRDDSGGSDVLYQLSDTTWEAYNDYGGNSLYVGSPAGRAFKVSYNRPFIVRGGQFARTWFFADEYPMIRWLEANGYNVSYSSGMDTDRFGANLKLHKAWMSSGHDEYWSGNERANVEAARAAGVHLAFFSGNEIFWKTRWENSTDPSNTPFRTLVSYKETHANAVIDPQDPPTWTGTWRDPRFSPPADGGRPENALSGNIFMVNCCRADSIIVPAEDGKMRFWRNTAVATQAAGGSVTLGGAVIGYEWDEELDNGSRPAGLFHLSTTPVSVSSLLLDFGSTFGNGNAIHNMTMYKAASGSLVFGAGTVRWSWGLDSNHDDGSSTPDVNVQQATVNLLADMSCQPGSLQSGLVAATASTDTTPPSSGINPVTGAQVGTPISVTGTATDVGGVVAGVEVSVDGGATWHPASGRSSWTFTWLPTKSGSINLRSRAVDDSGNLETPSAGINVTVAPRTCPCSIWSASTVPQTASASDTSSNELGVKFRTTEAGFILGVRFYKGSANTGTHVGNIWSSTGSNLGTATFTNESASGWQQINFATPVSVSANTTYIASYFAPAGGYAFDGNYFTISGVDNEPLRALANGEDGPNGVFHSGSSSGFPTQTFSADNYWVDVVFATTANVPPAAANDSYTVTQGQTLNVAAPGVLANDTSFTGNPLTAILVTNPANGTLALNANGSFTYKPNAAFVGTDGFTYQNSDGIATSNVATVSISVTPAGTPVTIFSSSAVPGTADANDSNSVELGVKIRVSVAGFITGVRFYKGTLNTGTHIGNLWTSTGTLLATATFSNETSSGWQQVNFASAVAINANTTYIASYFAPKGEYSFDANFFTSGVTNGPLRALANGEDGANGVFNYGSSSSFPSQASNGSNYWVDVVFIANSAGPPVANNDSYSTAQGQALTVAAPGVLGNDTSPSGKPLTAIKVTDPANGTVTLSADGSFTYTPNSTFSGADSFTYKASDGVNTSNVATVSITVTSASQATVWGPSTVPGTADANDTSAVEVGLKFQANVSGSVVGVRFYKGSLNTGTHIGNLWSSSGTLLATATFVNETASGWQQVNFTTPVSISANTIYVVSYFAPKGEYAFDANYFASAGVTNGPLHALANSEDPGGNGVFHYASGSSFPTQTFNAGNYWVDVVFTH